MYKVLIADDELLLLEGIRDFIDWKSLNSEVVFTATNGDDVLKYLKRNFVDILITDIRMPGADGIELAKYIYENKIQTEVIFLTSYQSFEYMKSGMEYGVSAYVLKDNYMDELEAVIKKVTSSARYRSKMLNEYVNIFILKRGSQKDKDEFLSLWHINEYICMLVKLEADRCYDFSQTVTDVIEANFSGTDVIVNNLSRFEHICLLSADIDDLSGRCKKAVKEIEALCNAKCRIGISNKSDDILTLHERLTEIDDAVNNIKDSGVMFYNDVKSNDLIKRVTAVIENRYAEPISLSWLANEVGISASYLSRKFNNEKGCTVTDYINRVRINKAVSLLEKTDMLVYEVSDKVGISEPAYFTNIFKKYMGVSPKKYKEELKK